MHWKEKEGLKWLEFDLFAGISEITHALFTRHGGFSDAPYGSLNFSTSVGDSLEHVEANREKVKTLLQIPHLILPKMTHGSAVLQVDQKMLSHQPECDGLITHQSGVALVTTNADCQTALFYDPIHKVVANVHCGWRGNVQNIYREAVAKMRSLYGTRPEELLAGISPSLGPDFAEFINYREELPIAFWGFQCRPTYFDLWEISRDQLISCGLLTHHIEIARLCTCAESKDFFSYRKEKVTGRQAAIIMSRQ